MTQIIGLFFIAAPVVVILAATILLTKIGIGRLLLRLIPVLFGAIAGGIVGFLLSPSVPLVGQLPLDIVINCGSKLQGAAQVFVPACQTSFNYLVAGVIIGGVVGYFGSRNRVR